MAGTRAGRAAARRAREGRVVHEKRRDHACPLCNAAFGEASNLTVHVRTVHEKRRDRACLHCAAAFGAAGSMTKHVRTVHEKRKDIMAQLVIKLT